MNIKDYAFIKNPISVIALFMGLAEAGLGYAITKSTGGPQVAVICIAAVGILLPIGGFFWILHDRPSHFWPPGEFQDDKSYLAALGKLDPTLLFPQATDEPSPGIEHPGPEMVHTLISRLDWVSCSYLLTVANRSEYLLEHAHLLAQRIEAQVPLVTATGERLVDPTLTVGPDGQFEDITEADMVATAVGAGYLRGLLGIGEGFLFAAQRDGNRLTLKMSSDTLERIGQRLGSIAGKRADSATAPAPMPEHAPDQPDASQEP